MMWPMFDPRMFFSQGFPGFVLLGPPQWYHPNSQQSLALKHTGTTSSDGDQHCEPYPCISTFLSKLANANLNCPALTTIAAKFEAEDLFIIDELSRVSEDRLRTDFGLSLGNAQFILAETSKEMCCIQCHGVKNAHNDWFSCYHSCPAVTHYIAHFPLLLSCSQCL